MAQNSNRKRTKNSIQNVRIVDPDEGTDDIVCHRLLQAYASSEGQIRTVIGYRGEISLTTGSVPTSGVVSWGELTATDDFTSFAAQYQEFRVKAVRFDVYDIQPSSAATVNYWSTYHQIGGNVPVDVESVMDRPDARVIPPGDGKVSLAWLAHGIPEMSFQSTTLFNSMGGLSYYLVTPTASSVKYTITAKFIVDFRGRK